MMEDRILEIMREVFDVEDIDRTVSQKNCEKWDSMAQLNLVVELESEFDTSFEPEEIGAMTDFTSIYTIVMNHKII